MEDGLQPNPVVDNKKTDKKHKTFNTLKKRLIANDNTQISEKRQKTFNSINTEGKRYKVQEGIEPPRRVLTLLKGLIRR